MSVFPGRYRRRVDVPNVRFEGSWHVWDAAPDLSCYTVRHEIEWKDRVYADISFLSLAEDARLIRTECCNHTDMVQNLVLHYMASAWDPTPSYCDFSIPGADVRIPENASIVAAKDYEELHFAAPGPADGLVWDGMRRAEEPVAGFAFGYGVGRGFGCAGDGASEGGVMTEEHDWVTYHFRVPSDLQKPCLCVRYLNPSQSASVYTLNSGEILELPHTQKPAMAKVALRGPIPKGTYALTLTAQGCGAAKLDCFVLCRQGEENNVSVECRGEGFKPTLRKYEHERFLTLHYPHIAEWYAIAWINGPERIRQIENDELDLFLRETTHDHVRDVLRGNGKGHFTNVVIEPILLQPGEETVLYGIVCSGESEEAVCRRCRSLQRKHDTFDTIWSQRSGAMKHVPVLPSGEKYALGQRLMQAVLCTNVVYPVYTRGQYIRHNTPGRWWDCLYTWDSGFIGMGLAQYSTRRGFDCLNAYLTYPGDDEAAFIHHGSLVPTQFYLYAELMNGTCSREFAEYCYPRLMQYYRFLIGRASTSTTANLRSGLLRPWDYFYNSGGWDDYPPQQALHEAHLEAVCTPVVTTAHAIRCAKILADTASLLGYAEDEAALQADAERLTAALQQYAWDPESGYFGYVLHGPDGTAKGIMRDDKGENYNMGLGGASPLFAGACNREQATLLWRHLEDPGHLGSSCGLSTVDQSASYYRSDGYWNGAVWMPYQWMFFKAALDDGRTDFAFALAERLLLLWQDECSNSYHCFEHFVIASGTGAGWHQFGGLSAPIVQLYASYYRPGTLTVGFDTFIRKAVWDQNFTSLDATLHCMHEGLTAVLAVTGSPDVDVSVSVPDARIFSRYDGQWEILFHGHVKQCITLRINPK